MDQYAIIRLGGKQYVVREGETFLVDRVDREEGKTFQPEILFLGGGGDGELAPSAGGVTAKVVGHERGPKIRIGKYRPKTGYKRHTGFRSSLTRIEITSLGSSGRKAAEPEAKTETEAAEPSPPTGLPTGYADMTVAEVTEGAKGWDRPMLEAAAEYEREHANRKGALAALESALSAKESS